MNEQLKHDDGKQLQGAYYFTFLLLRALAACWWPFSRRHSGKESLGMNALAAMAIIFLFGCWANSQLTIAYLMFWLVAVLRQKAMRLRAAKAGYIPHSLYEGWPVLAQKLAPFVKTESNLRAVDGFLAIALGGLLVYLTEPLGLLLIAAGGAVLFTEAFNVEIRKRRVQQMRDAQYEQMQMSEDYQKGHF